MKQHRLALRRKAVGLYQEGATIWQIIEQLGVNTSTLRRWLKESGVLIPQETDKMRYLKGWRTRMRELEYYED